MGTGEKSGGRASYQQILDPESRRSPSSCLQSLVPSFARRGRSDAPTGSKVAEGGRTKGDRGGVQGPIWGLPRIFRKQENNEQEEEDVVEGRKVLVDVIEGSEDEEVKIGEDRELGRRYGDDRMDPTTVEPQLPGGEGDDASTRGSDVLSYAGCCAGWRL